MKLTGNALSMLLKRYRSVLGKCRTLNWLAGMVLAGGLVLGGASGALADVPASVIWSGTMPAGATADTQGKTPLIITGQASGTISMNPDANRCPAGVYLQIDGTSAEGIIIDGTTGGSEKTSLWGYGYANNGYDALSSAAQTVTPVPVYNTISGGKITVIKGVLGSSQGDTTGTKSGLKISGGNILLNGAAVLGTQFTDTSYAANASIHVQSLVPVSGTSTYTAAPSYLAISGGNITVGEGNFGSIDVWNGTVNFTGGTITAQGQIGFTSPQGTKTDAPTTTTTWNMAGGKMVVESAGTWAIDQNVVVNVGNGSTITSQGTIYLPGIMNVNGGVVEISGGGLTYTDLDSGNGALNINGGSFTLNANNSKVCNVGVNALSITGGTVIVNGGDAVRGGDATSNWGSVSLGGYSTGTSADSTNGTVISGGTITVTNASLFGGSGISNKLTITSAAGGTGPAITLQSGNMDSAESAAQTAGIIHAGKSFIMNAGSITVPQSHYGVLLSGLKAASTDNTFTFSGNANISVAGNLTIAPTPAGRGAAAADNLNIFAALGGLDGTTRQATATMSGGTLNVESTGSLTLTKGLTMNVQGGNFTVNGALINNGILVASGGHINLENAKPQEGDGNLGTGGFTANQGGHLQFGYPSITAALAGSNLTIGTNGGRISVENPNNTLEIAAANLVGTAPTASTNGNIYWSAAGTFEADNLTITGNALTGNASTPGTIEINNQLNLQVDSDSAVTVTNFIINLAGDGASLGQKATQPTPRAMARATVTNVTLGNNAKIVASGDNAQVNEAITVNGTGAALNVTGDGTATFNKDVTISNGSMTVASGSTAIMDNGAGLDIGASGGATVNGVLNIEKEGTTLSVDSSSTSGITVNAGGVINATAAALGIETNDGDVSGSTVGKDITANAGSVINVTGINALDKTNGDALVQKLTGSSGSGGTVNVGNAALPGVAINSENNTATITAADYVPGLTNTALTEAQVTNVSDVAAIAGTSVGSVALASPATTLDYTAANQVLTINGAAQGSPNLITKNDSADPAGVTFTNAAGQVLTLGNANSPSFGAIGDVTIANANNTLNLLGNGKSAFSVGEVTGSNGDGIVIVSGSNDTFKALGTSGAALATVSVTNGSATVKNTTDPTSALINTNVLTLNSGTIEASDSVTVTTTLNVDGVGNNITGKSVSTPAITVAAGEALNITSTNGDVTLGGATTNASGGPLKILAQGGGVMATSGDTTATSIIARAKNAAGTVITGGNAGKIVAGTNNLNAPTIEADDSIAAGTIVANGSTTAQASVSAKTITTDAGGTAPTTGLPAGVTAHGGDVIISNGSLTLDDELETTAASGSTIAGNLQLTNVTASLGEGDKLTVSGTNSNTFDNSDFTAELGSQVIYSNGATLTNGSVHSYDYLETAAGKNLFVGEAATGGVGGSSASLSVNKLNLKDTGNLTVAGPDGSPSAVAIGGFASSASDTSPTQTLSGNITVGNNAVAALGTANIADIPASIDPSKGGLYIVKPINITGKQLTVGTGVSSANGILAAGTGSSTVINAAALTSSSTPAITGTAVKAADDAKLLISGAKANQTINLVTAIQDAAGGTTNVKGWNGENLVSDNPLISFSGSATELKATATAANTLLPDLDSSTAAMLNSSVDLLTAQNRNSPQRGVAFLSSAMAMLNPAVAPAATPVTANVKNRAAGDPTITSGPVVVSSDKARLVTKTIEGAERMIVVGAVPQMTRMASQAAAEAVTQRTSMAIPSGIKTQQATDKVALWVMPLYQSTNGAGMDAGKLDADFNGAIGGIALGADYTFANAIRAGISFNIGGGYATGGGDFADTTNNMNFWGLGAYAGWAQDNIGLSADVSFTSAYNKLSQDLPSEMSGWKDLKADVRSWALATGVKAEYKFETSALDIIPHLGVRYMYLNAEDYKLKSDGTVFKGDAMRQNIWTFPVGVNFSRSFQTASGWNVKPMADLMIVPALGDINANPTGRFTGPDYKVSDQNTQIMDHVTYQGQLGIEFGSDNLNFGLSGSAQFGEKTSGYGVLGSFRYEF